MNKQQKWLDYQAHMAEAINQYLLYEHCIEHDLLVTAELALDNHWYYLLLAAEANYSPPRSEKQQRQQKLWQQRGLLERTRANLRAVQKDCTYSGEIAAINNVVAIVENLIRRNQQQMITL